jgi:hypothetical protein
MFGIYFRDMGMVFVYHNFLEIGASQLIGGISESTGCVATL